jgi:ATP-dependent DNA ligase
MDLPVLPPLTPMLGRLARELPHDGFVYEPKWDGFRALAFRDGDEIEIRSRHDRPLARYFPELVSGLRSLAPDRFVLDGEILVTGANGFDFPALMARLHPAASRVERLRRETPALFVGFDLLALGDEDVRERAFADRRSLLSGLLATAAPPIVLTPLTDDPAIAAEWLASEGRGVDGIMAKHPRLAYRSGVRAMVKVKRERTAECVVAGFRWLAERPLPSSLLLGLYDGEGDLQHVGVASSFGGRERRELLAELEPIVAPLEGHPWEGGFLLAGGPTGRLKGAAGRWTPEMTRDWVPVAPLRVAEVGYDQLDGHRFRHPARFLRWRRDRDPRSCGFDQLEGAGDSSELLRLT